MGLSRGRSPQTSWRWEMWHEHASAAGTAAGRSEEHGWPPWAPVHLGTRGGRRGTAHIQLVLLECHEDLHSWWDDAVHKNNGEEHEEEIAHLEAELAACKASHAPPSSEADSKLARACWWLLVNAARTVISTARKAGVMSVEMAASAGGWIARLSVDSHQYNVSDTPPAVVPPTGKSRYRRAGVSEPRVRLSGTHGVNHFATDSGGYLFNKSVMPTERHPPRRRFRPCRHPQRP
jgi:hypothetical protein